MCLFCQQREYMAARRDPHHSAKGTTGKIVGVGKNQADLELVPNTNATGMATVQGEPATLLCSRLYLLNAGMGILLCASLPHQLS
jgi:hypothetical protein